MKTGLIICGVLALLILIDYIYLSLRKYKPTVVVNEVPVDTQDEHFVKIATKINAGKNKHDMFICMQAMVIFQERFAGKISGQMDVDRLLEMYQKRYSEICCGFPEFVENYN